MLVSTLLGKHANIFMAPRLPSLLAQRDRIRFALYFVRWRSGSAKRANFKWKSGDPWVQWRMNMSVGPPEDAEGLKKAEKAIEEVGRQVAPSQPLMVL